MTSPKIIQETNSLRLHGTKIQLSRFHTDQKVESKSGKRLRFLSQEEVVVRPEEAGRCPIRKRDAKGSVREELKPSLIVCCEDLCVEKEALDVEDLVERLLQAPPAAGRTRINEGRRPAQKDWSKFAEDVYLEFYGKHFAFLNRLIDSDETVYISSAFECDKCAPAPVHGPDVDRKILRETLYSGIFHRHRRTIFALGSFLRMLKTKKSNYNVIKQEGDSD